VRCSDLILDTTVRNYQWTADENVAISPARGHAVDTGCENLHDDDEDVLWLLKFDVQFSNEMSI